MKNLLAKVVAPFVIAESLFFAQPHKVEAEPKSGITIGLGAFRSAEEAVTDYYKFLMGAKIGVDTKINDYLRFAANLSIHTGNKDEIGIEREIYFSQFESMLQLVGKGEIGYFYGGAGTSINQVTERASSKEEDFEASNSASGIVFCGGMEFVPEEGTNWGGFAEISYRKAINGESDFGGTTLMVGGKYFFKK
jgi:hypothetical protein